MLLLLLVVESPAPTRVNALNTKINVTKKGRKIEISKSISAVVKSPSLAVRKKSLIKNLKQNLLNEEIIFELLSPSSPANRQINREVFN